MTSLNNGGIPNHGYTHWWTMFNDRQLLVLSLLLRTITEINKSKIKPYAVCDQDFVMGAFQQYLRNQNLFCFWDKGYDKLVPHMSNNNYHPKTNAVENSVFSELGRGNWNSCCKSLKESIGWLKEPWEIVPQTEISKHSISLGKEIAGKSEKVTCEVPPSFKGKLLCKSATNLEDLPSESLDLVITDPPFGGLLHYSELSDFFYVWMRLIFKNKYPEYFSADHTPKVLECVSNRARQPENPDGFYQRLLTDCWREAHRIIKPSGILAFTFHHSLDEPWVAVLESLFKAGFYLEATYPIRSDETKGEGAKPGTFGSQQIEYDILHVCRKRTEETTRVSWGKMRREVLKAVRQVQEVLELHEKQGLPSADLQVIKRGKALEYFSRHYGKVYVDEDKEFTVRDALIGINQLLDEENSNAQSPPPVRAEPFTR
jgi:adenine-specific DNA methylase